MTGWFVSFIIRHAVSIRRLIGFAGCVGGLHFLLSTGYPLPIAILGGVVTLIGFLLITFDIGDYFDRKEDEHEKWEDWYGR
jgi:hypothetical protein